MTPVSAPARLQNVMRLTPWQDDIIKVGELFRVGGSVRDELIGHSQRQEDIDYIVRGIPPRRLEEILEQHGQVILVGKAFGVYKFRPAGESHEFDIAFPRKEISTGPSHRDFVVDWDHELPIEADLGRRDFTINAIAQNVRDGSLVDPFDGGRDIETRTLRMIFAEAFAEDPLRILRGVRFAARFDLTIENATLDAMRARVAGLEHLSVERIQDELTKLLTQCRKPSVAFARLQALGALDIILPELARAYGVEQNEYHPDDIFWHTLKTCDGVPPENLIVRWAALLHDLGKVDAKRVIQEDGDNQRVVFYGHEKDSAELADRILKRLRYANDFIRRCKRIVAEHMFFYRSDWNRATVRRFIRRVGEENLDDLFALREADLLSRDLRDELPGLAELRSRTRSEIDEAHALKLEDMAIDGEDVMRVLALAPGPEVGRVLHELFEHVLDSPELNERKTLLKRLTEIYKK